MEAAVRERLARESSEEVALSIAIRQVSSLPQTLEIPDEVRLLFRYPRPHDDLVRQVVTRATASASSGFLAAANTTARTIAQQALPRDEVARLTTVPASVGPRSPLLNPAAHSSVLHPRPSFAMADDDAAAAAELGSTSMKSDPGQALQLEPGALGASSVSGSTVVSSSASLASGLLSGGLHGVGTVSPPTSPTRGVVGSHASSLSTASSSTATLAQFEAPLVPPPGEDAAGRSIAFEYPSLIPYRQRVILMWQRLEGQDVCIFALYVQEFGPDAPPPNTNTVYIAYLDSVRYLRPLPARTPAYHELLLAYLAHVRQRGFRRAYIWACPPQRGDAYIFHRHPPQQRTPGKDRLRAWYVSMIDRARELGIVGVVESLFSEHFAPDGKLRPDRGLPPFFVGDFWASETERLTRELHKESYRAKFAAAKASASAAAKASGGARALANAGSGGETEAERRERKKNKKARSHSVASSGSAGSSTGGEGAGGGAGAKHRSHGRSGGGGGGGKRPLAGAAAAASLAAALAHGAVHSATSTTSTSSTASSTSTPTGTSDRRPHTLTANTASTSHATHGAVVRHRVQARTRRTM